MNIARSLGNVILNPPERHSARWWVSRLLPPAVTTAEFAMAIATLIRHTDLAQMRQLLVTANLLDRSVSATQIEPAVALAILAITHIGGNRIMALLEILLKPLLNAQKEVGREEGIEEGIEIGAARGEARGEARGIVRGRALGREEANAELEAWKERQLAAGAYFVEIDDDSDENPSSSDQ